MKAVILVTTLTSVYSYSKYTNKGRPEIPDDLFLNPIHKGPIPEKRLPNIRIPEIIEPNIKENNIFNKNNILTGEALLERHREQLNNFIGTNILEDNTKGYNNGNHYYKGDQDESITNKFKRWYRPPIFPGKGRRPKPPPKGTPTQTPTIEPTFQPTSVQIETTTAPEITTTAPESTTAPQTTSRSCDFTGVYRFDPDSPFGDSTLSVCENNGVYNIGINNGVFTENIGRGTIINDTANGQILTIDVMTLIARQSEGDPCFNSERQQIVCTFSNTEDTFQFFGTSLERLNTSADPLSCYQPGTDFTSLIDPVGFRSQFINHVTNPTQSQGCFNGIVNLLPRQCLYGRVDQIFENTVRIACCDDDDLSSFFTPINQNTAIGTIQFDGDGSDDVYTIQQNDDFGLCA